MFKRTKNAIGKLRGNKKEDEMKDALELSVAGGNNDIMSSFFPPIEERTDMAEVIDKLNIKDKDPDLLKKLSELNSHQVLAISILTTAADTYNIPTLKKIISEYMTLMISKSRHGRREIIDLFGKNAERERATFLGPDSKLMSKFKG
jgi:hypothetical protein